MKKILNYKNFLLFALVLTFFMPVLAGCTAVSDYRKLNLEYTNNLEFLVGEDYYDANLKGYAIKADASKEDVTKIMKIDSSTYNKNTVGTYIITCKFEEFEKSYSVRVVNQISNVALINERLEQALKTSFKTDATGKLNYEAENSVILQGTKFDERLVYSENNGIIAAYLKWSLNNNVINTTP